MSSRKLEKRGIAVIALVFWMLIISFASPVYAANNIAVNSSSNSTVQDTTSTMTELNGANLSVSTDSGELYYMVSLDMRNNRTAWSAKTYGAFVIDGTRQRTMNLTRMAYPFNIVVAGSSTVTTGSHTVAFEVNHSGTHKGMIYSNNFSVRFLKTGEYATLDTVNSSAQITRSQVTGQVTVDNTQNSSISGLQSNDTTDQAYVNDTFLKLDGTSNMTSDLNMGNNYLTNSSSVNALNAKGASYWFDGVDDVITVSSSSTLNFTALDDFSIEFVYMPFDVSRTTDYLINKESGGIGWGLYTNEDDLYIRIDDNSNDASGIIGTAVLSNDVKVYIIVSYDRSGNATAYINGVSVGTVDISNVTATLANAGTLNFIQDSAGGNEAYGELYYTRVINRAVTATEVKAFYSGAPVAYADIGADNLELWDAAASVFTSGTYSWVAYGTNSIANVGNTLEITYGNHPNGAYDYLKTDSDLSSNLVVGKRYRITADISYTGGASAPNWRVNSILSDDTLDELTSTPTTYSYEFIAGSATTCVISMANMVSGNVVTVDNLSIKRIGAVGQWEQDGIRTSPWIDKSGNNNNGTVSGAVAINMNPHIESNGSDHSYLDQDVTNGASPTFNSTNMYGLNSSDVSVLFANADIEANPIDTDIFTTIIPAESNLLHRITWLTIRNSLETLYNNSYVRIDTYSGDFPNSTVASYLNQSVLVNASPVLNGTNIHSIDWVNLTTYPSGCSGGQAVSVVGDTLTCIEPYNETYDNASRVISYNVASFQVQSGTLDTDGNLTNFTSRDGTYENISETTGASPLTVQFNFTGVLKFNTVLAYLKYDGGAAHHFYVEVNESGTWVQIGEFTTETGFRYHPFSAYDPTTKINNGEVQIRFRHIETGSTAHDLFIDYLVLQSGGSMGGGIVEHGATLNLDHDDHSAIYPTYARVNESSDLYNVNGDNVTSGTVADARIASTIARDSEVAALDGVKIKPFVFVVGTTSGLQNMKFTAPYNLTIESVITSVHGTGNGNLSYAIWKNTSAGYILGNPVAADQVFNQTITNGRWAKNTSISQSMVTNDTIMINVSTATATGATIELEIYV